MQKNLAQSLAWIDEDEGYELNIGASEPGGASKHGVSLTVLSEWRKAHGQSFPATVADVGAVTAQLAGDIYSEMWAKPLQFDSLPGGVDYRVLDIAVNLGITGGATALQLALGLWPLTGVVDAETVQAANSTDPRVLIAALSAIWISKKHESVNWFPKSVNPSSITDHGYGHGWTNRRNLATTRALTLVKT